MIKRLLFLVIFSISALVVIAQVTKIRGVVSDSLTGEILPFVNVYLVGTTVGTTTNFDGSYYFETRTKADSIAATFVGYKKQVQRIKLNQYQEINFKLSSANVNLAEVVIIAGENPADIIMRNVIANKVKNSSQDLESIQYEAYNKIQLDANNFDNKLKDRKLMKQFGFVFDYVDTSSVNGKTYLPVFISEVLSNVYVRHNPEGKIEDIVAARGSGIENPSIVQFMGNLYQEVKIYDNYVQLLEKNFISPVADFGFTFYKYYLVDSAYIDQNWCYKLMFKPRRKQELAFTGELWIHDTTFAVKRVEFKVDESANLNFVSDVTIIQDYSFINNQFWYLTSDYLVADFNFSENNKKLPGFFGQRTTTYRNFIVNEPKEAKFYRQPVKVTMEEGSLGKTPEFWSENRHEKLTKKQEGIYEMIDSIENVPVFKTYADIAYTFIYGYLPSGKVEWGPLNKIISFNEVEGHRFRIGGRTTSLFSKNLRIDGHIAYGIQDQQIKYGAGMYYVFQKMPLRAGGINFKYDMEQLGSSFNAFSKDNLLSSLFTRQPADKLNLAEEFRVYYEHEWVPGKSNKYEILHRELFPVGGFTLQTIDVNGDTTVHNSLITTELVIGARIAFQERIVVKDFERVTLNNKYPIISFKYSAGIPGLINGEYGFHRLQGGIEQWFNIGPFGWSKYIVEAGRVFGTVPFPLLILHPGNETFIFDEYAFNLMNYYEFISDRYVSMYYSHHFDGFFLNRIPLMRKLKWREVFFVKGLVGTITDANLELNVLPKVTYMLDKPYFEAGAGIENIFKILRVDAIWRLSHNENEGANGFGVFVSLQFNF